MGVCLGKWDLVLGTALTALNRPIFATLRRGRSERVLIMLGVLGPCPQRRDPAAEMAEEAGAVESGELEWEEGELPDRPQVR